MASVLPGSSTAVTAKPPTVVVPPATSRAKKPTVVLLHGLLRNSSHMEPLRRHISEATGWPTHTIDYPSKAYTIKDLAIQVAEEIRELAGDEKNEVWAVTHSLGGIILRHVYGLENHGGITFLGICMLAPPNSGSCVARRMRSFPLPPVSFVFSKLYGKAGMDLGCELEEGKGWPLPPQPCGVIAGTRSLDLRHPVTLFTNTFRFFSGPNDGTVSVEETKLPQMTDFIEVHLQHSQVMWAPLVFKLVVRFLKTQRFRE